MPDSNSVNPAALEAMLQMVGGDRAFLAEMIDTYLSDSSQILADLGQAVSTGEAQLALRLAHSLKSNSEGFGAIGLAAIARRLEELARGGELTGASTLLAEAIAEYGRVHAALLAARPAG